MVKKIIYCIIAALCVMGCTGKRNYFPANMQPIEIEIERFDNALLSLPTDSAEMQKKIGALYRDFPIFMPFFAEDIIGVRAEDTAYLCSMLPQFLEDTLYGFKETNKQEQEVFANIADIQKELNNAFTKTHYLMPEWILPKVYFFVSGFNASLLFIEDDVAVGADMYLGKDWAYYNRVVYEYQKLTMSKEYVAGDILSAYLFRNIPFTSTKNRLLENMIYRGKVMYILQQLLAEEKSWDVFGYTKEKWAWCERNERAIWRLMMDKQDLYKTESIVMTSYLNDGPFTSEISQDCPARVGTWMGMRIVEAYMKNNENVSLQELMEEGDAQMILTKSKYKP